MPQIFGSYNSRFFAVLRDGRMALYRGCPLWTRPVASARELVRWATRGTSSSGPTTGWPDCL